MAIPGIQAPASRATRESWVMSDRRAAPAPGYCTLTATSRPSRHTARCTWPIEAAATGRSSNDWNFAVRQRGPELLGEDRVHPLDRHGWRCLLELGEGGPVGAGELLGHGRLHDRQGLPELHGSTLELTEHGEELLGGAGLELGGDRLGRCAPDATSEAHGGAPGMAQGQADELGGTGQGPPGDVAHPAIVS